MAILTRADAKALSQRLPAARIAPAHQCQTPYLQDGKPYRLEPKPRGHVEVLAKYGFKCEGVNGVLHVRVPLGVHGADHLGIDPATGEIVCVLCHKE